VDRTLNQNKDCKFGHDTVSNKILNSNTMFLTEITEDDVLHVNSKVKGKVPLRITLFSRNDFL
jgi:cytoskeletal protein CcmA (bactofilin family)